MLIINQIEKYIIVKYLGGNLINFMRIIIKQNADVERAIPAVKAINIAPAKAGNIETLVFELKT